MGAGVREKILIWTMAGGQCSYPKCEKHLVMSSLEGSLSLVGEVAHIVSAKADGPRGEYDLANEGIDFDHEDNLMLLCNIHHKIIDEHPSDYPVAMLKDLKSNQERKIVAALSPEEKKEAFELRMVASNIADFEKMVDIDNWLRKTEPIVYNGCPWISKNYHNSLSKIPQWVIARVWPKDPRYALLIQAFVNFKNILCDFLITFDKHGKDAGETFRTDKFYQISDWDPPLYNRLFNEWSFHVGVVEDLLAELTRSLNAISDEIRNTVDRSYRYEQGYCLISTGLALDLTEGVSRTEYRSGESYPGLAKFKEIRVTRDFHFSTGKNEEDPDFLKTLR